MNRRDDLNKSAQCAGLVGELTGFNFQWDQPAVDYFASPAPPSRIYQSIQVEDPLGSIRSNLVVVAAVSS